MPLLSLGHRHAPPDSIVAIFEDYARAGGDSPSRLADYWGSLKGSQPVSVLAALAKREIEARFARGEHPAALEYLERFPELAGRGDLVVSLVYEEFCLLEEGGAAPSVGQFCERYRTWSDSIASQLGYHRELSRVAGVEPDHSRYPKVGERFGNYTLQEVLGRGGAAKVYRAIDDLGERQVVLKVSRTMGLEPSILAALDHDNIVKIFTEVRSADPGMSGICMPYHPGVTLDAVLATLVGGSATPKLPRRARDLWDALGLRGLDKASAAKYWGGFPARGTYTEAVAWIGVVMADALKYAHDRGVFHRDIKPANILIARREGPLLFDFNLAHRHSDAARAQDAMSGGTLPYMAPEQLRAFVDPALWDGVRAGADVYALGLVLRELATGRKPPLPAPGLSLARSIQALLDGRPELARSVRQEHPDVPPALDAIIRKCLAPRVGDRYADAGQLADDLRCFLDRRPLLVAGNSSRLELASNWAFRKRQQAVGLAIFLVVGWLAIQAARPFPTPLERPAVAEHKADVVQPTPPQGPPAPPPIVKASGTRFYPGEAIDLFRIRAMVSGSDRTQAEKARAALDRLIPAYPQSAWPRVYKAFTLDRLAQDEAKPGKKVARHNLSWAHFTVLSEAVNKEDCVAALESWRTNPARLKLVLYMIGNHYAKQKSFERARAYYEEAIAVDKADPSPYWGLGDIARQQGHAPEAIDRYKQGLACLLDPRVAVAPQRIHGLCYFLIPLELREVDKILKDRSSPVDWAGVKVRLDEVRHHLLQFVKFHGSNDCAGEGHQDAFLLAVARGSLASGDGYHLGLAEKKEDLAAESFREASRRFQEAKQVGEKPRAVELIGDWTTRDLRDGEEALSLRIQECGLQELIPVPGPGAVASGPDESQAFRVENDESSADAPGPVGRPAPRAVAADR